MDVSDLEVRDTERVTSQALTWPERARQLAIVDGESYAAAAEMLKAIKALRAEVDATFDPIVSAAFRAHRTAVEQKRRAETPLSEAETITKRAMVAFDDAQERIRREEQRRLEEAERRRLEDERLAQAAAMEREGKAYGDAALVAEAEDLISQPVVPVIAPPPKATPVVTGQHFTVTWSAQVIDLRALVAFVAANPSHLALLTPNMTALNAQARSLKEHLAIPGVRPIGTKNVVSRR